MADLTREEFLAAIAATNVQPLPLPELGNGACVYIRHLRGNEAKQVQELASAQSEGDMPESRAQAMWCVLGLCRKDGSPLLTTDDMPALMDGRLVPVQHCAVEVMRYNGITADAETERKKE